MLKALELVGFKSFADKTRFEFPRGITVVVGPNGSGKSNIVDAIKWVLGEQSVKSLRGKEMADVIFNGSGARRAVNTAEITLTLDNSNGLLAIDTPEVHITRRVYRSGEGEYLINRQPGRLRDWVPRPTASSSRAKSTSSSKPHPATGGSSSRRPPASAASRARSSKRSGGWNGSSRISCGCRTSSTRSIAGSAP